MNPHPITAATAALAIFVAMLWGGNVVALKFGLGTFPPLWSAFWRFVLAGAAVVAWAKLHKVRLMPEGREWRTVAALGVLFTAQITVLNVGVAWTSAAFAVVLLNSHPFFTNLQGHFIASEGKLTRTRVVGLILALAGIAWVAAGEPTFDDAPRPTLGNLMMIVSANLLAFRVIYTRQIVQAMHPARPIVWQILFSLPFFFGAAYLLEPPTLQPVTWEPVAALIYQGVAIGGFCFIVWTSLLKKHSASSISMFAFTVPFFGVFLSFVTLGEPIGLHLIAGAGLTALGIMIATRPGQGHPRKVREQAVTPPPKAQLEEAR